MLRLYCKHIPRNDTFQNHNSKNTKIISEGNRVSHFKQQNLDEHVSNSQLLKIYKLVILTLFYMNNNL